MTDKDAEAYKLDWRLCFADPAIEEAFRADAFRLVFGFHCGVFSVVLLLLTFGLGDTTFSAISKCLFPVAAVEVCEA